MLRILGVLFLALVLMLEPAEAPETEEEDDPPATCAECRTDSECEALCPDVDP